jgi:Fic family protein
MKDLLKKIDAKRKKADRYKPLEPPMLQNVWDYYKIAVVYTSNAIEGFSYNEIETKILIEEELTAGGKLLRDAFAVTGHAEAYDHMFGLMGAMGVEEKDILAFHSLLRGSLDNGARPGEYRDVDVVITGSDLKLPGWREVPGLMKEMLDACAAGRASLHPVEAAAWIHRQIAFIHPFADGNGRVARLAMNLVFIQNGYLPAVIRPALRGEYIGSLKEAGRDDARLFRFLAARQYDSLTLFMRLYAPGKVKIDFRVDNSRPLPGPSDPPDEPGDYGRCPSGDGGPS